MAETLYSDMKHGNVGNIVNLLKTLNHANPIIFKEFFKPPLVILAENHNETPLTILDIAAYLGDIEILKLVREKLYDKNPHVKSSAATSGATPLHWAARQGQLQIVIYLRHLPCSLASTDKYGNMFSLGCDKMTMHTCVLPLVVGTLP